MGDLIGLLLAIVLLGAIISKSSKKKKKRKKVSRKQQAKKAEQLGKEGEDSLNSYLATKDGLLIKDLILKLGEKYVQIDHVFITDKAIFVIETKNHSGHIYGSEENNNWTVAYGAKKFKLYNPIKQNEKHAKRIYQALGLSEKDTIKVIPITVFTNDRCSFNTPIKGVYTFNEFINNYNKLINIKANKIDKRKYYNELRKMDLSSSSYHRKKQIDYATKMK